MKFSILIANYNNGKYFADCYHSIIAQTYKNWGAIIVDDGSTDDSVSLIEKLIAEDSRFKLIINNENRGCGFSKKKTLEFATGEICGFLDPDDAISNDALELSIKEYENEKIIATYSKITFCDAKLKPVEDFKKIKKFINDEYFFNCPIQMNAFFSFRKNAYDITSGINPDLKSAVDQDLYLKILEVGDVVFIEKNLYFYRRYSGGISQESSKNSAKENFAKVIFDTMKRRNLKKINGKIVPESYPGSEETFQLLAYQNAISYRIFKKIKLFSNNFF